MKEIADRISFCIYNNESPNLHFEEGIAILFGLTGTCQIYKGNTTYPIQPAGILVINPLEFYQMHSTEKDTVLCMRITQPFLRLSGWKEGTGYHCYIASGQDKRSVYEELRLIYARVFETFFQTGGAETALTASAAMQLIAFLQKHFLITVENFEQREISMDRLRNILDYIHHHWNEEFTLSEIAQKNFISAGYLSRFFQKHLHISFSQYVRELRLRHAAQWLIERTDSVTHIAYSCGFGTAGVFIESFRRQYGMTPGQYRQTHQERQSAASSVTTEQYDDLAVLMTYIRNKPTEELPVFNEQLAIDCANPTAEETDWKRILNIGYARDGLMAPIQQQILQAQQEIGFTYLRFHGVFDEDMHIYTEDDQGNPSFNFTYLVLLLDFILANGLKPYIELSFMPAKLAKRETRIFDRCSIIAGCRDISKWSQLIQATLRFCIGYYGAAEVEAWRFSTIAQGYVDIGCLSAEEYFELYHAAWQAVKSVDKRCQIGGPGGFAHMIHDTCGIPAFLTYVTEHECIPDFIAIQCYPHLKTGEDTLFMSYTLTQQFSPAIPSRDDDFILHAIQSLEKLLEQHGLQALPVYLEEVNATLWQRDLSSDTCYKAAWLAKNVCATKGKVVFGYWLLTDLIEERATLESLFHGGYGLMTYNGIPKAGYRALSLLSRMGRRIVDSGAGWMLTEQEQDYQLMAYHYCPYSNLYRYRYKRLTKPEDAYSVFEAGSVQNLQVHLSNLPDGLYRAEYFSITRSNGSSFDAWLSVGAPQFPAPDTVAYLKQCSHSLYRVETLQALNGLRLDVRLLPHEITLIVLHRWEIR